MSNYKKISILALPLLLVAIFLISSPVSAAGLADSAQPKFHHDQNNTGQSQYKGPQTNETKWTYTTGNMIGYSSPAIDTDGTVYVGSGDSYLYAFKSNGELKWKYKTGDAIQSSPTIYKNSSIYFGSCDGKLYALNSAGKLIWKYKTGSAVESSPAIGSDGTIYFGSCDGKVYALTSAGKLKWKYQTGNFIISSPAVGNDGTIYIGSEDQYFYALTSQGKMKWRYKTGKAIYSDPVIGSNGKIYTGSGDGYLYAFNFSGKLQWKYKTGKEIYSLALSKNGIIYIGNRDGKLYAVNSSGKLQWTYTAGNSIRSSPAIGNNGNLYFGSHDGKLYALNSSGKLIWKYQTGSGIEGSAAIANNGNLYFGSIDRKFYAIQDVYVYATPAAGSYNKTQTLKLTSNRAVKIYYTMNGSNPTISNTIYTKTLSISKSTIIKYFAVDTAGYKSQIYTQNYIIDKLAPKVTVNIKGGTYKTNPKITLKMNESGSIYYTTNESKPTSKSKKYTTPLTLKTTTTLKYLAIDKAGNKSPLYTQKYVIKTPPKITKTNPTKNATKISSTSQITVTFDKNITKGTNFNKIYVKNLNTSKLVTISKSIKGNTLTIKQTKGRISKHTYLVYLPSAALKDLSGNKMAATYSFKFKTK